MVEALAKELFSEIQSEEELPSTKGSDAPLATNRPLQTVPKTSSHPERSQEISESLTSTTSAVLSPRFLEDIAHAVKLSANVLEAHSITFLAPQSLMAQPASTDQQNSAPKGTDQTNSESKKDSDPLRILCAHTLTPESMAPTGSAITKGPLSWVARTGKSLQIVPFEGDARSLAIYTKPIEIKSLAAVPVRLPVDEHSSRSLGVLIADSLKSYRFAPLQMKLLGELSDNLSRIVALNTLHNREKNSENSEKEPFSSPIHSESFQQFLAGLKQLQPLRRRAQFTIGVLSHELDRFIGDSSTDNPHREETEVNGGQLIDSASRAWNTLRQLAAENFPGVIPQESARSYPGCSGKVYFVCQGDSLAPHLERMQEVYRFSLERTLRSRLRSWETQLDQRIESAIRIESFQIDQSKDSRDSIVREIGSTLGV